MKKCALLATVILSCFTIHAQVNMPADSPTQTITEDFGMGKITLTYSRPSVKGRTVFGEKSELAPLGEIWRTGANAATKLVFTSPVAFGGKNVDTGTYVLYTIPGKTQWEVVLNKGLKNWGTGGYSKDEDVARFTVPVAKLGDNVETFTMQFAEMKPESCELHLMWAKTAVKIPITTNIKDQLRAQIETALQGEKKPYFQAAKFYMDYDKNYPKALENINKALEASPNAFYMYLQKAKIQQAMGDKNGAKQSANKCIEEAKKANNGDYARYGEQFLATLK